MTLFNPELQSIQADINYHEEQITEAKERLDQIKVAQAYSDTAIAGIEDCIENIDPFYLPILRGHIESMFNKTLLTTNNEFKEVNTTKEEIRDPKSDPVIEPVKEDTPRSRAKLLGIPDFTPTKYEDITPKITYSSDGRAYIGFNDRQEAEKLRESLDIPSLLDDAQIMNNHKWELKFYCDRQYLEELQQELENDWTPEQKAELDFQERLIRIAPDIFYDGAEETCYLGFRAKGRADNFGSYLTRILDIAEKYVVTNKPRVTTNTKYELRLNAIGEEEAKHLGNFNLKKDYDHPDHREAREIWRTTRQREVEPACKPRPKVTPLDEIDLGEIVSVGSNIKQYKVVGKVELDSVPHLEVIATYNSEMPTLVGKTSYLKEAYRVLADDIYIDPKFHQQQEEPIADKPEQSGERDFPSYPYTEIALDRIEFGDIITSTPYSRSAYIVKEHKGEFVMAQCLYHKSLPGRVGEEFSFTTPYLVEKATSVAADKFRLNPENYQSVILTICELVRLRLGTFSFSF